MNNTLENIKEAFARERGFKNWEECLDLLVTNREVNEVAERYAHSQTQELVEMVKYLYNFSKGRHFHTGSVTDRTVTEILKKYQKP